MFYLYVPVKVSSNPMVCERLGEYRVVRARLAVSGLKAALALAESKRMDLQEAGVPEAVVASMRLVTC